MKYLFLILFISLSTNAEIPSSFSKSKKLALAEIYKDHQSTFYCGCSFNSKKQVDQDSCGYTPRNPITRSGRENTRDNRIEWEHVLPASYMGKNFSCWGTEHGKYKKCVKSNGKLKSGRDCCQKVNPDFRKAHNDLVNLTPSICEVNGDRSNLPYSEIIGENRVYGKCDFEIDFDRDVVEPHESIRGDIARIQLYLEHRYGNVLMFEFDADKRALLKLWDEADPVSEWEVERNNRICEVQGSGNELVGKCE